MPPVTRGFSSSLLVPGLRQIYVETGKEVPLDFEQVVNVSDMEWNPITDGQYTGLGTMPEKPEGSQFRTDRPIAGGTKVYTAVPYGFAFEVTWEMWRDERFGLMEEMTRELRRSSMQRLNVSGWAAINNAFSTSYAGFEASKSLCSTSHVGLDGVTRTNRPSVDIGLSVTAIQGATTRFMNMTNERNLPLMLSPDVLVLNPAQRFTAREILGSSGAPYQAANEINSLVQEDLRYIITRYKTSTTSWLMLAKKGQHDINFFYRDRPMYDSWDDPTTKNAVFAVYQRHTDSEYGSWKGTDGSTG